MQNIRAQIEPFLSFEGENAAVMVNNLDWTAPMSAIDFLRDVGKHFRVNKMLTKDAVAARLNSEQGISYTEFSYQLLQALDFLELHRRHGCTLQIGGSDQWGNLTAGLDLIRRVERRAGARLRRPRCSPRPTAPSSARPRAARCGWTPSSPRRTRSSSSGSTPTTATSSRYLKVLSFRSRDEIEELEKAVAERPQAREAQRALAEELTALVHGEAERDAVVAASQALFGRGELAGLDAGDPGRRARRAAAGRGRRRGRGWPLRGGPVRRHRPGTEQERGPPRGGRGRRLPQQRPGDRPEATALGRTTCSPASGWCCAAASGTWPRSGSGASDRGGRRTSLTCGFVFLRGTV